MKEEVILPILPASRTEWDRVNRLTDAEIEAACAAGADDILPTEEELRRGGALQLPDGRIVLSLPISAEDRRWLDEHQVSIASLAAGLVHGYVQSQRSDNQA